MQRVSWRSADTKSLMIDPLASIEQVAGLSAAVRLEIFAVGSIFDVCVNGRRTAIHRAFQTGDELFLFAAGGQVVIEDLEIRPLD